MRAARAAHGTSRVGALSPQRVQVRVGWGTDLTRTMDLTIWILLGSFLCPLCVHCVMSRLEASDLPIYPSREETRLGSLTLAKSFP